MRNPVSIDETEDGELARLRGRIRRLSSEPKTLRRELKDLEVEVDIMKTTKALSGKDRGADRENPAARERTILVRRRA